MNFVDSKRVNRIHKSRIVSQSRFQKRDPYQHNENKKHNIKPPSKSKSEVLNKNHNNLSTKKFRLGGKEKINKPKVKKPEKKKVRRGWPEEQILSKIKNDKKSVKQDDQKNKAPFLLNFRKSSKSGPIYMPDFRKYKSYSQNTSTREKLALNKPKWIVAKMISS